MHHALLDIYDCFWNVNRDDSQQERGFYRRVTRDYPQYPKNDIRTYGSSSNDFSHDRNNNTMNDNQRLRRSDDYNSKSAYQQPRYHRSHRDYRGEYGVVCRFY